MGPARGTSNNPRDVERIIVKTLEKTPTDARISRPALVDGPDVRGHKDMVWAGFRLDMMLHTPIRPRSTISRNEPRG